MWLKMDSRPNSVFHFEENFHVTDDMKDSFDTNGYIVVKGLLNSDEVTKLKTALENEKGVMSKTFYKDDGANKQTKIVMWNHPGKDITGIIGRSEKAAGTFEKLLGGEVYHYHTKVIMKEAHTGGRHVWHQDYGYWYENGCVFPNMGTLWIGIDRATRQNGCLQILPGSHLVGRVDHVKVGGQFGADLERVAQVKKFCPLIFVELEPGDGLFFHCNLLHMSAQNGSDRRRWAYLVAYNRADNNPVYPHHHPQYTKLHKVPNSAILECSSDTDMTGKEFFDGSGETLKRSAERLQTTKAKVPKKI